MMSDRCPTLGRVLGPYRQILTVPGAFAFAGAGFVARMPASMTGIGIVLLVSSTTGSYGVAGGVAAALSFAYAVVAPQLARLVDRLGQARVLAPAVIVHALALAALMAAAVADTPHWTLYATAVLAGASVVSIGSLVRARWTHLLTGTSRLHTAYALESVIDELIFVVGPVLVTLLATEVHRLAGLSAVATFAVVGGLALAAQRHTEPPLRHRPDGERHVSAVRSPTLLVLLPVMAGFGGIFGAVEVAVVAFADEAGARGVSGPILAAYALGSLISGVWYGAVAWRSSLTRRFVVACGAMAVSVLPLPLAPNLAVLAVAVFIAGFAISPTLIGGFALVQAGVPSGALTEGLAWISTGLGIGVTLGSALAGQVIDEYGASQAFLVAVATGLGAAVIAFASARTLARSTNKDAPGDMDGDAPKRDTTRPPVDGGDCGMDAVDDREA